MNFVYRVVKEKKESNSVEILPDDTFQLTRKKSGKRNIAQGISESCRLHQWYCLYRDSVVLVNITLSFFQTVQVHITPKRNDRQ